MTGERECAAVERAPLGWMFDGDRQTFATEHYLQRPYAKPGACGAVKSLGDWPLVGRLVSHPGADVLAGRQGQVREEGVRTIEEARSALASGFTVGLRHVQRIDEGLAGLADQFATAFGGAVDIHLYCTPAAQPGFGWHYDAEEVFVLQTVGSKTWKLRKNTVNPWPLMENIPKNQRYEREISPVMACRLEAGDWLYIPSGYWHATEAHEESISLSVGIRPVTGVDLFDALRGRVAASMLWRQRLPMNGVFSGQSVEERTTAIRELCVQLADDLSAQLTSGFLAEQFAGGASTTPARS
jgi:50S ribosomal protein L16 3-hydroxylase